MKKLILFLLITICYSIHSLMAQDVPIKPTIIINGVFLGETPPLKDLPALTAEEIEFMKQKALKRAANKIIKPREYPFAATAFPKGEDAVWQKSLPKSAATKAPLVNFEGQTTSSFPPDCNGTVGPSHYMQTVNTTYAIYNKSGTKLAGPTNMNLLFNGVSGATCNDGDPLIQYDEQAQRWVAVEFSLCGANDLMLVAVSSTNDPTGTWYAYSFDVADMPDYEKIGIWQDGYYMGTNTGSGNDIYVMERSKMLQGLPAQMVAFDNSWRPGTGFLCVPPLDNDATFAPAGTPGLFIAFNDDAVAGGTDQLWIYELAVNWTTPANSTFVRSQQINVTAFDSKFQASWNDITQPTSQKLDGVPQVIMNAPQYRNFGTYQTIVCCHTVDVDNTDHAGIRWYELRKTPPSTTWTIRQQGTLAPDAHSRWMGSIMLNGNGKIGLAYSISSSTIYPGIRYCGQSAGAYANATGLMDVPEEVIHNGTVAQISYNRWGDYALLSVDPNDDETFWFTSEYVKTGGTTKGTKIASFRIGSAPFVTTNAATNVAAPDATLNGTVNPNGLATTYNFQWGTTAAYGNTTTGNSAGSGTSNVAVNANITGLVGGTPYHFRVVATNSDGTSYGSDLIFTPGAASLTTAAASAITLTTAISGGNVITDGGSAVTARGVCWSTSANPIVTGNHTTDSSGTGIFTSSITGLSANTLYHVRAYATNANGTFYGDDLTFTTLCSIYSLPFTESFTGTTIPNCWTQVDISGNGQIWQFGTITGQSPNPALTGNYAFLNSDAYGSGNSQNADLITPTFDLSGYTSVNLAFSHYFKAYTGSSGKVLYSIDNGSTWTIISTISATTSANPTAYSQAVNAVNGQSQVKFKWNYTGTWGYYWGIDNINITSACTLPLAAGTITGTAVVCQEATSVAYSVPAITGATSYVWAYSGTGASLTTSTNSVSITFASNATSGNLTVYGVNTCGNGIISASYPVTVNPNPVITPTATPATICNGAISSLSANSNITGTTFIWNPVGLVGTPVSVTPASTTVYIVTGTVTASGCVGIANITVTVNPNPVITPIATPSAICNGGSSSLAASSSAAGTTFLWAPGGLAGTPVSVMPTSTTIYTVTGTAVGCTGYTTITVNVNPSPVITPTATPTSICVGASSSLSASSSLVGTTYQWMPGSFNSPPISVHPVSTTIYTVTGSVTTTGCTGTAAVTLNVNPNPVITQTATPSTINSGSSSSLAASSDIIGTTFLWNPGGLVGTPVSVSPGSTTSYTVTGNASGCTGSSSVSVTVNPLTKTLQVKVFLEGLYIGGGLMRESSDFIPGNETFPPKWFAGISDTVTVVLYNDTYGAVVAKYPGVYLHTDGNLTISGISSSLNNSYYITIFQRSSVPVTSATPRSFAASSISYDFTSPSNQAYGNEAQKLLSGGVYGMHSGELDHDTYWAIDGSDLTILEPDIISGPYGYLVTDLNGDGVVDGSDLIIMESNVVTGPIFWNPLLAMKHLLMDQKK